MVTYAFTGHRPKDLPQDYGYYAVATALDGYLELDIPRPTITDFVTGGALGIDSWVADYAMRHRIPLHLYLPFEPQVMRKFWPIEAQLRLDRHIDYATTLHITHRGAYDVAAYQKRNEAMVDAADRVLAFWTGKQWGGTANCIRYAKHVGKPVVNLLRRN